MSELSLLDRIELRRFVGREMLLWLWFESEISEGTLSTKEHGSFGLWLEGRLVLDAGRESTVIRGSVPGQHREAKESLLRGKMPARAGLHLSFGDKDVQLSLVGDTLALAGLSAPAKPQPEAPLEAVPAAPKRPAKRKTAQGAPGKSEEAAESELAHEAFYDRMHHARDVEAILAALYRDFLALRLSPAWEADVFPAIEAWSEGKDVDGDAYESARNKALGRRR